MRVVALGAQRRHLSARPLFIWDTVRGEAVVAEPPCFLAAVYAWPAEHLVGAHREDPDLRRRRHPKTGTDGSIR